MGLLLIWSFFECSSFNTWHSLQLKQIFKQNVSNTSHAYFLYASTWSIQLLHFMLNAFESFGREYSFLLLGWHAIQGIWVCPGCWLPQTLPAAIVLSAFSHFIWVKCIHVQHHWSKSLAVATFHYEPTSNAETYMGAIYTKRSLVYTKNPGTKNLRSCIFFK